MSVTSSVERDAASVIPELAVSALTDVNLTVRAGEVVALAGENGAGKTTLIRAIAGDVPIVSGSIKVGGQSVAPVPRAAARLGVRVVWQDLALAENLDVAANVMLGNERRRHLFSDVALHKDAAGLLGRLGIPLRDTTQPVRSLSGGQRQMVAVARAMAREPRLLLLDEPTAGMNPRESAELAGFMLRLRDDLNLTILLIEHDMKVVMGVSERVTVLNYGAKIAEGAPAAVRADAAVIEAYLGKEG